jgi:hypothetical protein
VGLAFNAIYDILAPVFEYKELRRLIALSLSEDGEKKSESVKHVWRLLNENMKTAKPPIQQLILTQARILARAIRDQAPYTPFKAKW